MSSYLLSLLNAALFALIQFMVVLMVLAVLFLLLAGFRLRRAINYATPVFVALEAQMDRFFFIAEWCVIPLIVLAFINHTKLDDYVIGMPPLGSQDAKWGQAIFGFWFMMFLGETLQYGGFPPALPSELRADASMKFRWMALMLGFSLIVLVTVVSTQTFWVMIGVTGVVYALFVIHFSYRLANVAYWAALPAKANNLHEVGIDAAVGNLRFVHVTDIHITKEGEPRNEPEPPGNWRLRSLGQELPHLQVAWLLITGDLADHGREEEWQEACLMLKTTQESAKPPLRILVAPGNHDLATAYNTVDAFFTLSVARRQRRSLASSDGTYLRRYLRFASELEPQLLTSSNKLVTDVLVTKATAAQKLIDRWQEICKLGTSSRTDSQELAQAAINDYPETSKEGWASLFARQPLRPIPAYFEEILEPMIWLSEWYTHFPLHIQDEDAREAVLILNSNAPDPTMFGSAWGQIGLEQLEKLATLLDGLNGYTVYLLCHHAPFRWSCGKHPRWPGEVRDWATAPILTHEIEQLRNTIKQFCANDSRNEVVFLCGHRHGGDAKQTLIGTWDGGIVIEGASFADANTKLAVGWKHDRISVGLLPTSISNAP